MTKYTDDYIEMKISRCRGLVENATSDAQREIYQGYLDFWEKWKTAEKKTEAKEEPMGVVWLDESEEGYKRTELTEKNILTSSLDKSIEVDYESEFKRDFPNKQAYYSRNGEMHITKAFKEYLNKTE